MLSGEDILNIINEMGFRQVDLAEALETSPETVNRWIRGGVVPQRYFQKQIRIIYADYKKNISEAAGVGRSGKGDA